MLIYFSPMCDFTDYGILEKQKITKKIINEDDEVWEDQPELEILDNKEEKEKEKYITLIQ